MQIKIKVDGKLAPVDVARKDCPGRPCFWLGQDKGTYTPGRGYTSYHAKPRWVCMTRHTNGCPIHSVCSAPECRTCSVLAPGEMCERCGAALVARG